MSLRYYIVMTLVFGLLQVWTTALVLALKDYHLTMLDLIKDGGLFFFTTSLTISSLLNHCKIFKNIDLEEILFSISGSLILVAFSCIGFTSGFERGIDHFSPTQGHHIAGILLSALSLGYGMFTEKRLKKLIPE